MSDLYHATRDEPIRTILERGVGLADRERRPRKVKGRDASLDGKR